MSGGDTLAAIGEKVTDLFVNAFTRGDSGAALVFLPFSVAVPDDIVQGGAVNPTRMAAFLTPNFDAPYLMSATQYSVHGKDLYYGAASQIYSIAVSSARPTAAVGSDAWKQTNSNIAMAQSTLNPSGVAVLMTCTPDDWVLPENSTYWSQFDSTQSQGAPTPSSTPAAAGAATARLRLMANPAIWAIKPAKAQSAPVPSMTALHSLAPAIARTIVARPPTAAAPIASVALAREAAITEIAEAPTRVAQKSAGAPVTRIAVDIQRLHWPRPSPPPPPPDPPPSSNMSLHFEYMAVTIGYTAAGVSVWDGAFLADKNWCAPGVARGGFLPAPEIAATSGSDSLTYGLPIALIVVRNLNISVKWSGQDRAALGGGGGFLGPFSLAGASAVDAPDGSIAYSRPGMQVIGLLCSRLPVLPPADAPDIAQATNEPTNGASGDSASQPPASAATSTDGGTGGGAS